MAKQCGECRYLDPNDIVDGKGYCSEKCERRFADNTYAESCSGFFRRGWGYTSDSKDAIRKAEEYHKKHNPGHCFITTAIVHILGMEDKCKELETLRRFREDFLQKDSKYKDLLLRYDTVGPVLARALANDLDNIQVSLDLYSIYIRGCIRYIEYGKIDEAITLYTEMVTRLINRYMITPEFVPDTVKERYVQDGGGHGAMTLKTM